MHEILVYRVIQHSKVAGGSDIGKVNRDDLSLERFSQKRHVKMGTMTSDPLCRPRKIYIHTYKKYTKCIKPDKQRTI
jgi:hypothetical protein